MTAYLVPLLLLIACAAAMRHGSDAYDALAEGAEEGLRVLARILPTLIVLLTAVHMLRASGALELLAGLLSPLLERLGLEPELLPLMLLRPVSGSGALALGSELIATYGPDSSLGQTAAVLLGSTETTFYVIAVYLGAANIKRSRYAVVAALIADFTAIFAASWAVRTLLGS